VVPQLFHSDQKGGEGGLGAVVLVCRREGGRKKGEAFAQSSAGEDGRVSLPAVKKKKGRARYKERVAFYVFTRESDGKKGDIDLGKEEREYHVPKDKKEVGDK